MAPDLLQLGAKWPLESKCYFETCHIEHFVKFMIYCYFYFNIIVEFCELTCLICAKGII